MNPVINSVNSLEKASFKSEQAKVLVTVISDKVWNRPD